MYDLTANTFTILVFYKASSLTLGLGMWEENVQVVGEDHGRFTLHCPVCTGFLKLWQLSCESGTMETGPCLWYWRAHYQPHSHLASSPVERRNSPLLKPSQVRLFVTCSSKYHKQCKGPRLSFLGLHWWWPEENGTTATTLLWSQASSNLDVA